MPCAAHVAQGTNIGIVSMTISKDAVTISASSASARSLDVDAIVIGVVEGEDGPRAAPGAEQVVEALGGELDATLAVLGATGKVEEVTKLPSGGRLQAPARRRGRAWARDQPTRLVPRT